MSTLSSSALLKSSLGLRPFVYKQTYVGSMEANVVQSTLDNVRMRQGIFLPNKIGGKLAMALCISVKAKQLSNLQDCNNNAHKSYDTLLILSCINPAVLKYNSLYISIYFSKDTYIYTYICIHILFGFTYWTQSSDSITGQQKTSLCYKTQLSGN